MNHTSASGAQSSSLAEGAINRGSQNPQPSQGHALEPYRRTLITLGKGLDELPLEAAKLRIKDMQRFSCLAMSLNQDSVTVQPVKSNEEQQFVVQAYNNNAEMMWERKCQNTTTSPPNIDPGKWNNIVLQYTEIGRIWLTAIPNRSETPGDYQWLCTARVAGELVNGSQFTFGDMVIDKERVKWGMAYLQCRYLGISTPQLNRRLDIHRILLEFLLEDLRLGDAERTLKRVMKGYKSTMDTTCVVTKARFAWQGDCEVEIKLFFPR